MERSVSLILVILGNLGQFRHSFIMKSSFYRKKWSNIKTHIVDPEEIKRLSRQVAHSFMDSYLKDSHYEEDYIDLLCEMTTISRDPGLNSIAARALFSIIIESLCDEFEELQTETYNRVMTQVINFCLSFCLCPRFRPLKSAFCKLHFHDISQSTNSLPESCMNGYNKT